MNVWKSRSPPAWNYRLPDWPGGHSRSVQQWGETRAIKLLITQAWWEHSVIKGKPFHTMPVEGLLDIREALAH